jgi:LEA14-like dessication related protein
MKFMRNLIYIVLLIGVVSCSTPEAPELKYLENVQVNLESFEEARLHADALLYNPNKNAVIIKSADIDVLMENKSIGKLDMEYNIKVEGYSDFQVPLDIDIKLKDLNLNAIGAAFGLMGKSGPELHFLGKIKVKAYGVPFSVKVDHKQKVNIKL